MLYVVNLPTKYMHNLDYFLGSSCSWSLLEYATDFSYALMFPMAYNGEENGFLHFIHAQELGREGGSDRLSWQRN